MKYDFDEIIERRGTGSVKWDESPSSDVIPMWVADMDFKAAPAILEAIRKRAEHGVFGYALVEDDYYDAIISWFQRRHQWTIRREEILYTTGVIPAMSCAIKALTMPGEKVLILSPDYNCFFSSIHNNGCEVLESVLRFHRNTPHRFEVDWEDFEHQCADEKTTAFLLCNPHNPTGRVWTREELQQMADICHRHQVHIISDEIHCELIMPDHQFCPMATVDDEAIILNSPTKSFNIAGLQVANIICRNAEWRRRINRAININEVCDLNPFGPVALKAAYNESEAWIDELNQYLWDNYQALSDFVAQNIPQWKVMPLEGTYLVWVDVSLCCDNVTAYTDKLMQEAKVWLNPGTMYGAESGKGYVRINIACPKSRMMEALQRISTVV
jgi:cystathionine beta-lyase